VRYFTLTDVLDRPADAPELVEARAAIPSSQDVQAGQESSRERAGLLAFLTEGMTCYGCSR